MDANKRRAEALKAYHAEAKAKKQRRAEQLRKGWAASAASRPPATPKQPSLRKRLELAEYQLIKKDTLLLEKDTIIASLRDQLNQKDATLKQCHDKAIAKQQIIDELKNSVAE
uniref:Uncharacterized protein n=1 Tax=Ditylenchus dipsaci TaxID=166011 RepID=A0A915DM48_9BILA